MSDADKRRLAADFAVALRDGVAIIYASHGLNR